ncbi:acyltransferase family protein [Flavobacterium sp. SM15]|uniref:acyltransferase family protein n=1 Tax=Flavobacterium sp. SM15 TaxID=2908005 RepID=UPI00351CDCF1
MERNFYLDCFRIFLSFLIIGLHFNFLSEVSPTVNYIFVQGISRIAVPTFLIINGYYFFSISSNTDFLKWLKRLYLLYSIWMIIYAYFWFHFNRPINSLINFFFFGYYHLWYLISLLQCALVFWLIKKHKTLLLICCFLFAIIGILLQYLNAFGIVSGLTTGHHRNFLFFCFPFFTIGYLINKNKIHLRTAPHRNRIRVGILIGIVFLLLESYLNYKTTKESFDILLSLYFLTPLLFIEFINSKTVSNKKNLALISSSIYLSHVLVHYLLALFFKTEANYSLLVMATFLICYLVSFLLIHLNKRYKYIL